MKKTDNFAEDTDSLLHMHSNFCSNKQSFPGKKGAVTTLLILISFAKYVLEET